VSLLEVEAVSVRFGGQMALDAVSLDVEPGRIAGLIGPNGAGKTTLFNVVTGLLSPTGGAVRLDGVDITSASPHDRARRGMARTFQRLELFGSLTARENLQVASEIPRRGGRGADDDARRRVERTLERTGMSGFADRRADQLTTGQARLTELGRALVTTPRVLLLDEPASGLDVEETDLFADLLVDLARDGVGLLVVEHDMHLVMRVCQQLFVLDFGRVIAAGTPETVQRDQTVIGAYLGTGVGA
jgi:branched-chain amino acid transport system ATP-binding protein